MYSSMTKRIVFFLVHLLVVCMVALGAAWFTTGNGNSWGVVTVVVAGLLFALIASNVITNALHRLSAISDNVSIELNKLRRIHHLARAFSRAENQIPWFDLVREAIESYLGAFEVIPFSRYDDTNEMFRRITMQLYGFDKVTSEKGKLLFAELMTISGQATEARQRIHELRGERMSMWAWGVLVVLAAVICGTTVLTFGDGLLDREFAAGLVVSVLLVLVFVFHADTMRLVNHKKFTKRYVDNIERMGFWPEEKK